MTVLILGLVLFLGVHSVRIVADDWRTRMIAARGENTWKGLYSLLALAGFALVVWGYGLARQQPVVLWTPPVAMRHLASLFTLLAFVFITAAYVPANGFKARLRHPMMVGTKLWALAHLLANGNLADVVLFGGFFVWAVLGFRAARARDRTAGTPAPVGTRRGTITVLVVGVLAWAVFAFWAHGLLIGVRPFGR